jgi:hypothetical protein
MLPHFWHNVIAVQLLEIGYNQLHYPPPSKFCLKNRHFGDFFYIDSLPVIWYFNNERR